MSTATTKENKKAKLDKDKKDELFLDSLEIKGYRCFEHLIVEKLGRVNLIVGKNNVGKTALLEALWIYSEGSSWNKVLSSMAEVLERRNERSVDIFGSKWSNTSKKINREVTIRGDEFRHLFSDRPNSSEAHFYINSHLHENDFERLVHVGFIPDVPEVYSYNFREKTFHEDISSLFVNSGGLEVDFLTQVWDEIILSNKEDHLVESLKIIVPQIIDLNFIGYPKGSENRIPVARIENVGEKIPLKSLGEGMSRLLGLSIALSSCANGILLVDEIEIGLHYSILPDVWNLIFKTAKELNVQVFATTHSKDCVEAFAVASNESPEDGELIRLERHGEKIVAKTISEERLAQAVNHDVEVR